MKINYFVGRIFKCLSIYIVGIWEGLVEER